MCDVILYLCLVKSSNNLIRVRDILFMVQLTPSDFILILRKKFYIRFCFSNF